MKKAVWVVFIIGISLMLYAPAMAKRETTGRPDVEEFRGGPPDREEFGGGPPDREDLVGDLDPPGNFTFTDIKNDSICFDWEDVKGATKYSVDIEFEVDSDGDGESDTTVELSFGTSDRTDGADPSLSQLCVLLTDLIYEGEQLYGTFTAKVKAMNPGPGGGRQNHPFSNSISDSIEFMLTPPGDSLTME